MMRYTIICCAMLCYAMLCYDALCYTILCCAMLLYSALCYALCYDDPKDQGHLYTNMTLGNRDLPSPRGSYIQYDPKNQGHFINDSKEQGHIRSPSRFEC